MSASVAGGNACACAFIEIVATTPGSPEVFGVGMDANIVTASIKALIGGANRLASRRRESIGQEAA